MTNDTFGAQTAPSPSKPDSRLRSLDKLLGTWDLKHRAFDTGEEWRGQDTFEWMDGGFFLAFHHEEFGHNIKGIMLIGYERKWGENYPSNELIGHWFESTAGYHFEYVWEVGYDTLTFWLGQKGSDAAFHGIFSDDGNTITGAWRWPGGGYELTMTRLPIPFGRIRYILQMRNADPGYQTPRVGGWHASEPVAAASWTGWSG